jgi:hypothetical protein
MKFNPRSIILILPLVGAVFLGLNSLRLATNLYRIGLPTEAPTPTPGESVFTYGPTTVPLAQPLVTEEQALRQALQIDANEATWEHPWSLDTLKSEPGRITLEAFPSRSAEDGGWYAPEIETDAGSVWRITIRGRVRLAMLGMGAPSPAGYYDSVTYIISQRHGGLLGVKTGKPLSSFSAYP